MNKINYNLLDENKYLNQIYALMNTHFGVSFEDFIEVLQLSYELSLATKSKFRTEPFTVINNGTKERYFCLFNGVYIVFYLNKDDVYLKFKTMKITEEYYQTLKINAKNKGEL